jgi:phosphoglycolate phosphatase
MAKRYDLLVFDWDGTLIDSAAHIAASLQKAFQDLELPVPSSAQARHVIGLGLQDAMAYLNPALERNRYEELTDRYRVHFLAGDPEVALFPAVAAGIPGLNLEGYLLGIATGKSRRGLDRSLHATGLAPYFHASRCADEGLPKPHPDMLQVVMDMVGTVPERTLMVGDTTHDLQMAQNAGVGAVAVSYGAHGLSDLESMRPLGCVSSFEQLMRWLKKNG